MALPSAGNTITLNQVNVELGLSSTALIALNDAAVRTLAGVGGSGTIISMSNLHGKSNYTPGSVVLTSGSSWTVPNGVTNLIEIACIGGGAGGSGGHG
jgi:hypothetical protein